MIKNKFLFYLFCGVTLSPALALGECKPTQNCRALGYKEAPCPEQGVKCPFGETWYCPLRCSDGKVWKDGKCQGAVFGQCTGYAKNCKIGDILNNDGTCSNDKVSGKAPIGVVGYISSDGNCGQAVALDLINETVWSNENIDIAELPNLTISSAKSDFESCKNTQIILDYSNKKYGNQASRYYPAFWKVRDYAPSSVPLTKGKWCITSAGLLNSLYQNKTAIEQGWNKSGSSMKLGTLNYWAANEYSADYAFILSTYGEIVASKKAGSYFLRFLPVIEF